MASENDDSARLVAAVDGGDGGGSGSDAGDAVVTPTPADNVDAQPATDAPAPAAADADDGEADNAAASAPAPAAAPAPAPSPAPAAADASDAATAAATPAAAAAAVQPTADEAATAPATPPRAVDTATAVAAPPVMSPVADDDEDRKLIDVSDVGVAVGDSDAKATGGGAAGATAATAGGGDGSDSDSEADAPQDPAPFLLPPGTTSVVVDRRNLSKRRRELLTQLFHELDLDHSGHLQIREVAVLTGQFSKRGSHTKALLSSLDTNGDGVVSLKEFLDFFAQQSGNLTDAEFQKVYRVMLKTAKRGQRLITWPTWAFYLVGITAFAQLIVRGVLLGLTVDQWTVWNDMDEVAGLAPASSSVLRLVAALLGLPLAVCGLYFFVFPPHKHPRRLTYLGYAGAVIMVLFLASGIVDGISHSITRSDCRGACETACKDIPAVDLQMCRASRCSCGLTVLPGPAADVQDVRILTDTGAASGSLTLTVFNEAGDGFTTDDISATATPEEVRTILETTVVSPEGQEAETLRDLLGVIITADLPDSQGWSITFTQQFVSLPPVAPDTTKLLGAGAEAQTVIRVRGRPRSDVVPIDNQATSGAVTVTLWLNFVAFATSALVGLITVIYTSEWGRFLYLGELHTLMGEYSESEDGHKRSLAAFLSKPPRFRPLPNVSVRGVGLGSSRLV